MCRFPRLVVQLGTFPNHRRSRSFSLADTGISGPICPAVDLAPPSAESTVLTNTTARCCATSPFPTVFSLSRNLLSGSVLPGKTTSGAGGHREHQCGIERPSSVLHCIRIPASSSIQPTPQPHAFSLKPTASSRRFARSRFSRTTIDPWC